ncbi:MAG: MFS transporter [Chloroflexota bacterium]|nr:MFS transporter [Chloroflexota bacterium]MDE2942147.1 MFS transporter [Chloroflexota bacterium]MDE3268021.1 MFS transporter [Chloroflexota bacterium]
MESSTTHTPRGARRITLAARLVVLAVFLDLFMQFPTIAPYAESLGASAAIAGIAVAAYSFTNMFGNLGAGPLLDRMGRRGPMIAGMAISAAAVLAYSVVQSPAQLMAARAIHGLGAAVLAPGAFSIIGDSAPSDRRGQAMGLTGALIALAALAGPPAAGILRDASGADAVFLVDAALLIGTLVVFVLATRGDSLDSAAGEPSRQAAADGVPWRKAAMWSACGAAFAIAVGVGALVTHLPMLLEGMGESAARTGYSFAVYALVAMLVMASPTSRAGDRYGRVLPTAIGLIVLAGGLGALGLAEAYPAILAGMALFGLGYGLVFPAAAAMATAATGSERRGTAFGIFYAVYSLGVVVGASGSGRLAEIPSDFAGYPFLAAAAVVLLAVPPVVAAARVAARPLGSNGLSVSRESGRSR